MKTGTFSLIPEAALLCLPRLHSGEEAKVGEGLGSLAQGVPYRELPPRGAGACLVPNPKLLSISYNS